MQLRQSAYARRNIAGKVVAPEVDVLESRKAVNIVWNWTHEKILRKVENLKPGAVQYTGKLSGDVVDGKVKDG